MVAELKRTHQLEHTLHEAQEQTADLRHELICEEKMQYQGDEPVGLPSERGPPAATIVRRLQPEPEQTAARDFLITDAHGIGQGSLREKAQANIAAIRALKQIESENRDALETEKLTLVKYTGWGAMANAFRPYPPQEWERVARDLRELLTDDEYSSARASTPNAHFTSPMVIRAMWQAMQQFVKRQSDGGQHPKFLLVRCRGVEVLTRAGECRIALQREKGQKSYSGEWHVRGSAV
jgi:hypothetical protein